MLIKGVTDEDFVNYKKPSMFIAFPTCTFKCEKECGQSCCQNSSLAKAKAISVDPYALAKRYKDNKITKAVVMGGLEPFDSFHEVISFIDYLRKELNCNDPVVIYTGYNEEEVRWQTTQLRLYKNVIVKFGRYVPGMEPHFDKVLGVKLASDNQHAIKIS